VYFAGLDEDFSCINTSEIIDEAPVIVWRVNQGGA
jgi:hypothetical protein